MVDHKLVRIVWIDSGFYTAADGWSPVRDLMDKWNPSKMEAETVGMLMYEDEHVIAIGLTYSPSTESTFGLQIIAKPNIKTFEVLHAS